MWMMKLVALGMLVAGVMCEERKLSGDAVALGERSVQLALDLYHTVSGDKASDNILLSPVVVACSLGLVSLGGKGSTAAQAKSVLRMDKVPDKKLHEALAELLQEVSNVTTRNVTWRLGSRLYGPTSVSFTGDFVKRSKEHFSCDPSKLNYRDKKSALTSINKWAAQATDGKLPELTTALDKTDGATIVNAMFFKPHWDEKFHHKMVDNRGFMVKPSFSVGIPMMHRTGFYNLYRDEANKVDILEMPLAHKLSSMVFIMPFGPEPLDRLEKLLTKEQVNTWMRKVKKLPVAISLPRVSLEVSHHLEKHLANIGLTEAVDKSKADLSKMSGKKDLYLANVVHGTALELDVEGNPFDATIYSREELKKPKVFYADHPFIFFVKDKKTNSILFIGRLVKPKGDKLNDEL
uniref:Serpin H1 n=2 Tax=Callorhinchus milii TaxID=7868 RepID=V9KK53_CALMI